jgi:uncharacterized Zn finger protein
VSATTLERIDKARRLLIEGRLQVTAVGNRHGWIVASCRGDSGEVYSLGYDPRKKEWRCTCPARSTCSHIKALQLVTVVSHEANTAT